MRAWLVLLLLMATPAVAADARAGAELYLHGRLGDGGPVAATVQGDVPAGRGLACASCHRRSGLGGSEGGLRVPALTREALFAPLYRPRRELGGERADTRPAYDPATLARAIREGVDSAGRPLDPLMPRYALGEADMANLSAWLAGRSDRGAPGVEAGTLHLATVVTPDADPAEREAMLALMRAYVALKNGATRGEPRRAANSPWTRDWRYPAWRRWELHVWELAGAPQQWGTQLAAAYAAQPVFAVVGGLGRDWRPVHAFCEDRELPCVFPHTRRGGDSGWYTRYLSAGSELERAVALAHLKDNPAAGPALLFPAVGVLPSQAPARIYLGSEWHGMEARLPQAWRGRAFLVDPYRRPALHPRLRAWMLQRGVTPEAPLVQADTWTALSIAGEALMHIREHFSREYFLEKVEHLANRLVVPPAWESFSLGPDQRHAAKGAWVRPLAGGAPAWFVPGTGPPSQAGGLVPSFAADPGKP